ncbi:hypothetical protein QAD02_012205 [Eretmocerus hayati]|uniref:Uncharacterized protein n=1 Tax=Eretmocerus hayati TaxID=131215 RepID=A0ACC2NYY6_9HYME|nr:hypothetical protein QAD02_012205 [Eretmocerus hayati]
MQRDKSKNNRTQLKKKNDSSDQKKPFDKKKYREQKYSNKFKVNQWEERRRKAMLRNLYKDLKRDEQMSKVKPHMRNEQGNQSDDPNASSNKKPKIPFFSAKQELTRKKQEQQRKKEEFLRVKKEKEEAIQKYKEKRMKTFKKLSQKTKKGQPVMRGRMELLLEKIQSSL